MAVSGKVRKKPLFKAKPKSSALRKELKAKGLRMPHGYDLVLRKKK